MKQAKRHWSCRLPSRESAWQFWETLSQRTLNMPAYDESSREWYVDFRTELNDSQVHDLAESYGGYAFEVPDKPTERSDALTIVKLHPFAILPTGKRVYAHAVNHYNDLATNPVTDIDWQGVLYPVAGYALRMERV